MVERKLWHVRLAPWRQNQIRAEVSVETIDRLGMGPDDEGRAPQYAVQIAFDDEKHLWVKWRRVITSGRQVGVRTMQYDESGHWWMDLDMDDELVTVKPLRSPDTQAGICMIPWGYKFLISHSLYTLNERLTPDQHLIQQLQREIRELRAMITDLRRAQLEPV